MPIKPSACHSQSFRRYVASSRNLFWSNVVALFVCVICATVSFGQTPSPNIANTSRAADQRLRSSLRVNPSTLAVEFELPLANYPGRGGLNVPVTLRYSSKVWRIAYQSYTPSVQSTFDGQFLEGFTSLFAQFNGGWTSSVGIPAIMHDDDASRYNLSGMPLPETTDCDHTPCYRIDRMFFRMPDNTVHELRSSDEPYNISNSIVLPIPTPDDLYAVDGSGLRYQRSTQTLFLPDGSRYILNTANPSYVDRNGNTITFNADSPFNIRDNYEVGITDTLGRSIPAFRNPGNTNTDISYSLPGFNGLPMTYTVKWRHLGDAGVMTTAQPLNYISDFGCPAGAGGEAPVSGSPNLFSSDSANRNFICDAELFNPMLLHQIVLPNGQAYTFTYNVYGELDKVVLPSGGYQCIEVCGSHWSSGSEA